MHRHNHGVDYMDDAIAAYNVSGNDFCAIDSDTMSAMPLSHSFREILLDFLNGPEF